MEKRGKIDEKRVGFNSGNRLALGSVLVNSE
jgi:hypothetical protein